MVIAKCQAGVTLRPKGVEVSKATGVRGKTPQALARFNMAKVRQDARQARTAEEQIGLLATRPGASKRELDRLGRLRSTATKEA